MVAQCAVMLPHSVLYVLPMRRGLSVGFLLTLKNACRWTGYAKFPLGVKACVSPASRSIGVPCSACSSQYVTAALRYHNSNIN